MATKSTMNEVKMAARIYNREDNLYKQDMIKDILRMYADEVRKCMINGERVQISKVGTIIPVIKTHIGSYNMPTCNNFNGNPPPCTKLRITQTYSLKQAMDSKLLTNIKNGIWGLIKLPLDIQQFAILKRSGYIPKDAELKNEEV